jgi:hypothetical protein
MFYVAVFFLMLGFRPALAAADQLNAIDNKFVGESVVGEYIDLANWNRFWIADGEVHKVAFEPKSQSKDVVEKLVTQRLVQSVLTLRSGIDKKTLLALSSKLRDRGVEIRCKTNRMHFLVADGLTRVAIIRYPNSIEDKVVDMQVVRSGRWAATYLAFRSKELARIGALPFSDEEYELAKTLPLDDLPFNASTIVYRISNASKPNIDWCTK